MFGKTTLIALKTKTTFWCSRPPRLKTASWRRGRGASTGAKTSMSSWKPIAVPKPSLEPRMTPTSLLTVPCITPIRMWSRMKWLMRTEPSQLSHQPWWYLTRRKRRLRLSKSLTLGSTSICSPVFMIKLLMEFKSCREMRRSRTVTLIRNSKLIFRLWSKNTILLQRSCRHKRMLSERNRYLTRPPERRSQRPLSRFLMFWELI